MAYDFKEITDVEESTYRGFEESYHSFETFFQSWEWGQFEKSMGKEIKRVGVYKEGVLIGVMSLSIIKAKRGKYVHVRNGPLIDWNNIELAKAVIDHLKQDAKNKGCSHVRISPLIKESAENREVMKALGLKSSPVHDVDAEVCWFLDLTKADEQLLSEMRTNTRYHIKRKRSENVEYEFVAELDGIKKFWPIFEETVKRQKWNAYSQKYFENEFSAFNGKAIWALIKADGVYVAGVMLVIHKGVSYRHHAASLSEYRKLAAPYLLEWKIIEELKKREVAKYNMMGIARTDNPKDPWAGLSFFKKGFGGYEWTGLHSHDIPISRKYLLIRAYEVFNRKLKGF